MLLKKNRSEHLFNLLALVVFLYVLMRAVMIPITHDEAYSFHNIKQFWYAEALCTGNTHWLNSLGMKAAIVLNAEQVPALRWLSITSAFVFFGICLLFLHTLQSGTEKLFVFSVLFLHPYLLDYFSIARGYAPGLMMQALSLYLFFSSLRSTNRIRSFYALLCAASSSLCNFSFIYFFVAFAFLYFRIWYLKKNLTFLGSKYFYRDLIIVLGVVFLVFRALLFIRECSNDVIGAGTMDLRESIRVFADGLFAGRYQLEKNTLDLFAPLILMLVMVSAWLGIQTNIKRTNLIYYLSSVLLLIQISLLFVTRFVFDQVLPAYRSALFLLPLSAFCFVNFLLSVKRNSKLKQLLLFALSGVLVSNFIFSVNFTSVHDYSQQADVKQSFDYLEKINAKQVGMSPELFGCYRNYFQMTEKYRYSFSGEELNTRTPLDLSKDPGVLTRYDHLVLLPPYDLSYYRACKRRFSAEKFFPNSGALILRVY